MDNTAITAVASTLLGAIIGGIVAYLINRPQIDAFKEGQISLEEAEAARQEAADALRLLSPALYAMAREPSRAHR